MTELEFSDKVINILDACIAKFREGTEKHGEIYHQQILNKDGCDMRLTMLESMIRTKEIREEKGSSYGYRLDSIMDGLVYRAMQFVVREEVSGGS